MHSLMRRAWVDIDLGALLRNATSFAEHAGVPLLPMVKADAYGLGAVRVSRLLDDLDPDDARVLRDLGQGVRVASSSPQ